MKPDEFVTADLHFGHKGIIHMSHRPFENVEEMDAAIIANWNRKVPKGAVVYLLGDVSFRGADDTRALLGQLHGRIRVVRGNHDKRRLKVVLAERAEWVRDYYESKTETDIKICMFHYPLLTWNGCHHGSWHLHGHSHGNLKPRGGRRIDVGIDCHPNFEPFSFEEIQALMLTKEYVQVDHHVQKAPRLI